MPLLGGLIFNAVAGFAAWLAQYLTQKVAVTFAIAAVLTAMFIAMYTATRSALSLAIGAAGFLHPMFAYGVSMVISERSASLISSYIVFWSLCELYKWKVSMIQLWSRTI